MAFRSRCEDALVTSPARSPRGRRQPLSMRAIAWACGVVSLVCICSIAVLVWPFPLISTQSAADQIDALKTALTIGAGAAGAATLILAGRRQVHLEEAAATTELDAKERRITELYVKAVDQLGSEKAPVRLGGLHALERLAQDNPAPRQTVVDVICSYLRMPFTINDETAATGGESSSAAPWLASRVTQLTAAGVDRQELEVRLSAQSILIRHLRPDPDSTTSTSRFWPEIALNLTAATLIDFEFQTCRAKSVRFVGATFVGMARFYECTIDGQADFDAARFLAHAWFRRSDFVGDAWFGGADFHGAANFRGSHFHQRAVFGGAAWFGGCSFRSTVEFDDVIFDAGVDLNQARVRFLASGDDGRTWPTGWQTAPDREDDGWLSVIPTPP